MTQLSLIVTVLDSHEVVRRQLLHLNRVLTSECELLVIDDGSTPSLEATCDSVERAYPFRLVLTHDRRSWTQPRARNIGAQLAQAEKLLFFDIDHIVTADVIAACQAYEGDRLNWYRRPGILDAEGRIVTDRRVLVEHGMRREIVDVHVNSFLIRRAVFERLGGYDERFLGQYGGEDHDFNRRYAVLVRRGLARPHDVRGEGYRYPDTTIFPALFHALPRRPKLRGMISIARFFAGF